MWLFCCVNIWCRVWPYIICSEWVTSFLTEWWNSAMLLTCIANIWMRIYRNICLYPEHVYKFAMNCYNEYRCCRHLKLGKIRAMQCMKNEVVVRWKNPELNHHQDCELLPAAVTEAQKTDWFESWETRQTCHSPFHIKLIQKLSIITVIKIVCTT